MDEIAEGRTSWSLDEHLNGCLAGYQSARSYGAAVFFALEALWGIARDVEVRARADELDPGQLDDDWTISPTTNLDVPWIWISSLSAAWEKYKTEGGPLGQAFGLEGGGRGKQPIIARLNQMLDERAIAHWIWSRVREGQAAGKKMRIEDAVQDAAETFDRSDVTVRRAWRRFGSAERKRHPGGS